jgi:hypothetical protein
MTVCVEMHHSLVLYLPCCTPAAPSENQHRSLAAFRNQHHSQPLAPSSLVQQPFTMEEACADGNLELAKESFKSLLLSSNGTIPLTDRVMPGGAEVIQRSTCIAARHGHTAIFSFLLDQGAPINAIVAGAAFEGNNAELCQALLNHGWEPRAGDVPNRSVEFYL